MIRMDRRDIPDHLLKYFRPVRTYKPKDDAMIPHRVFDALMADGWWGRSDIVWSKPSPMPESVMDRPTKAHEYLFLLSKSERYYYDAEAVAEESVSEHGSGNGYGRPEQLSRGGRGQEEPWTPQATRNRRTVWEITTKPFPSAHFAVFPPALVEPCIQAGTSEKGCCPECGAPWERVVEKERRATRPGNPIKADASRNDGGRPERRVIVKQETTGWQPTCDHDTDPVPCTVLDPFAGSGTTGMVATGHGRDAVLIDLSPDYAEMMSQRIGPMFVEAA